MNNSFAEKLLKSHKESSLLPNSSRCNQFVDSMIELLFPIRSSKKLSTRSALEGEWDSIAKVFESLLLNVDACHNDQISNICSKFLNSLPWVYEMSIEDADGILEGDPAAKSLLEVIATYPGFYGMIVHRLAHELYKMDVPYLPRMFSEYAHSKTGIDIHPGARIGRRMCIDHGTGIVIGETCEIGDNVKIYQGVTLGGLSVKKSMAATKRHPTIEDGVVIYSGSTILGGETTIGKHSIIGGNVWLTKSVPPHSIIYYDPNNMKHKSKIE